MDGTPITKHIAKKGKEWIWLSMITAAVARVDYTENVSSSVHTMYLEAQLKELFLGMKRNLRRT
jgi:hypothetical protein